MKSKRRRVESIFQDCLEAVEKGEDIDTVLGEHPEQAEELRKRLETALWLKANKTVLAPRAGFASASRQRWVRQVRQAGSSEITRPRDTYKIKAYQHKRFWLVLNLISLGVLVLVLGFVGSQLYSFAETALPGDSLYSVKLLMEKVRLDAAPDAQTSARLHVEFASRRSDEIVELIFEGRFSYLMGTSTNMRYHVQQADRLLAKLKSSDPSTAKVLSEKLKNTFASQNLILELLIQSVPKDSRGGVEIAMAIVAQ